VNLKLCLFPIVVALAGGGAARADGPLELIELPEMAVNGYRTAVEVPAATYAQPVSALRYLPLVDVQARNLAEGQADVAIRGGTFENTGLRLGAATFWDPQTGHYLTELPLPGAFLSAPTVGTGPRLALGGLNATAGEVSFEWAPIGRPGMAVEAGGGTDRLRFGSARGWTELGPGWNAEVEVAASAGDGTRSGGDHRFTRVAGRVETTVGGGTTTVLAGRQEKFFAWPFLYAPEELHQLIGSSGIETEDLRTDLVLVTHSRSVGEGELSLAAYHRRHRDDYELDRAQPGLFNPYEHETRVSAFGADLAQPLAGFDLRLSGRVLADELESTALVFGPYQSRTLWKLGAEVGTTLPAGADARWELGAGGTVDGTNRGGSKASPLARLAWIEENADGWRRSFSLEAARTTQQPGYTAIGSNPNGGLFRGDPSLGRGHADQIELAAVFGKADQGYVGVALFHRKDRQQVDWVYPVGSPPTAARFARSLDVDVTGVEVEAVVAARDRTWRAGLAYAWMQKDVRRGLGLGEASFYGLNFPRHRVTAALVWRPTPAWELRTDQEWRVQERNALRRGSREAWLSSVRAIWRPTTDRRWEFTLTVDNLADRDFEAVPGVPGTGRQASLAAGWRW